MNIVPTKPELIVKDNIEVLILAGGKGTRLAPVISDVPKPMAPVNGKPFLEYQIDSIKLQGFKNFRILVGYKSELIRRHFENGGKFGVQINYTSEDSPLGTGGALKKAIKDSTFNNFLVLNGDSLFEIDIDLFLEHSEKKNSMALKYCENTSRYGQVTINNDYQIQSFIEKSGSLTDGYINAGVYFFQRSIVEHFPNINSFSLEQDVMPTLIKYNNLKGLPMGGKFIDIGVPEDYELAQTIISQFQFNNRKKALFLDRDGIIIEDSGYVSKIENVHIYDDIIPIIRFANENEIPVFIITNQAGVGRGYFSEEDCNTVNKYILSQLKEKGAKITDYFYCPYHKSKAIGKYLKDSLLRKPNPGMILLAQNKYCLSIKNSLMIGDKVSDIISLPGLNTILLQRQYDLTSAPKDIPIYLSLSSIFQHIRNSFS